MAPKLFALLSILAALATATETAQAVLARMNKESASFRQIAAKLTETEFTQVLNDKTVESGQMWLERNGRGIVMRSDFTSPPNVRSVGVDGDQADIYYPNLNTVQIYDLGKFGGLVDQFLVLGFGSSGKDIEKDYSVKVVGDDTVGGQKTSRLELTPKSDKARQQIEKVELWIPVDAGHPVQQRFQQPGGDYYLFTYSDIKLNPGLPDSMFHLKVPANAKKEYPQK
jgi:outer membrane lipoprotein-sorting protein